MKQKRSTLDAWHRVIALSALAALLVVFGGVVYFFSTSPVAYQKIMSLRIGVAPDPDWSAAEASFDVRRVIGAIPYSGNASLAYVLPSDLYEATILNGLGNCANKCRGLSYYLEQRGMPFQRIELLHASNYLRGSGHVLIRARYRYGDTSRVGLVDMLEGGLPEKDAQPIDLEELVQAKPFTVSILPLNSRCDRHSDYYGSFLDSAVFATTQSDEIQRYFRWVELVWVPLGDPRLERFLCNASAIVLGLFPQSYVSADDYERLVGPNRSVLVIAQSMTWATRLLLVLLPALGVVKIMRWMAARRAAPMLESPMLESPMLESPVLESPVLDRPEPPLVDIQVEARLDPPVRAKPDLDPRAGPAPSGARTRPRERA